MFCFVFFVVFLCFTSSQKEKQLWQWGNESNSRLNSIFCKEKRGGGGRQYACKRCAPIVVETKNASPQLNIGIEIFPSKSAALLVIHQWDAPLFVFVGRF